VSNNRFIDCSNIGYKRRLEMKNQILVTEDKLVKDIMVRISDIDFSVDNIGKPSMMFWLTPDLADRLAFHLNCVLQDIERKKEQDNLKASEELRDAIEENISKHHEEPAEVED
jgi:hypothetical protein